MIALPPGRLPSDATDHWRTSAREREDRPAPRLSRGASRTFDLDIGADSSRTSSNAPIDPVRLYRRHHRSTAAPAAP
jgi:hypothetical protein